MFIGEAAEKYCNLLSSEYIDYDNEGNEILLENAPPDIVKVFDEYKKILEEEKRTGKHIF